MPGNRSRKEILRYRRYLKEHRNDPECDFCHVQLGHKNFIAEGVYFKVIRNIFPYSIWDELSVLDHLMLVPKRHVETLNDLPEGAAVEYVKWLGQYEVRGYSSYARAPGVTTKSVAHHHTHLLQTSGERVKFFMHAKKPYFRAVMK